jgi:PST family polysaccharide transporter
MTAGHTALIQGLRRIGDLAKLSVYGSLVGVLAMILLVYFLREDGIALSLVIAAGFGLIFSWTFARRIREEPCSLTRQEARASSISLLALGFVFMSSGFLMMGAAYAVRVIVIREAGLDAAGFYQAAWTLGGLYVGIILQAMGTDFYPRLTAAIADNRESNRLVNEQAEVSLLLAGPGVIATLALAPVLMVLFYSKEFIVAAELLQWLCLGMALRVITWPIGFIIVARGEKSIFLVTEAAWATVNVSLSWICIRRFGLEGAGVAFFGSYVFHWLLIYPIVRRLTGFRWAPSVFRVGWLFVATIGIVFAAISLFPLSVSIPVVAVAMGLACFYSLRRLTSLVPIENLPRPFQRLFGALGITKTESI